MTHSDLTVIASGLHQCMHYRCEVSVRIGSKVSVKTLVLTEFTLEANFGDTLNPYSDVVFSGRESGLNVTRWFKLGDIDSVKLNSDEMIAYIQITPNTLPHKRVATMDHDSNVFNNLINGHRNK